MSGIGGSSASTDRGAQLGARQGLWSVFNTALPIGWTGQAAGNNTLSSALSTLGSVQAYYQSLLAPGRANATTAAAPAINTALDQADATRAQSSAFGTGRTGGATALQREAGTTTSKNIDDIINQSLQTGRSTGASGLTTVSQAQTGIGEAQLRNALSMLGLGTDAVNSILTNATSSRQISQNIHDQAVAGYAQAANTLMPYVAKFLGL